MFDDGAEIRQFGLLFAGQILRWEFGVGNQDLAHAHFLCTLHEGENLVASQVSGGQNHIVPADQFHADARLRNQIAALVDDAHTRRRDAHGGKFALNFGPERKLFVAAGGQARRLIFGVNGRHPDELAAGAAGDLHGDRVKATYGMVQGDRAKRRDSRNRFGHHLGALGRGNVVRFQYEALQAAR